MLERWKRILTNWNNCYFIEKPKDEQNINTESLINIISYLRQNYNNLDESKSSLLEAHTIKEFVLEKYPDFKCDNGSAEPETEDEIYMVASLLLFFVCVNSKDVHIKNAMCSKLCSGDQETILKFSKCLLECSTITYRVVQTAITEACGQDVAAMEVRSRTSVTETPPALRSLHSEVRRLQAALEAERFDRNYLQEELGRTNARLDKVLKEKEQHKIDIVNLKAKISGCCGEESETKEMEADDRPLKLTRQLHDLEEKLVETQEQLDEMVYQRDTYKAKIDELKHERNKWLTLHQEEVSRCSQLSEELETERRQNQTLQELLAELRQHNKLNGLDSSSLECDDPDASIQTMPHNASVCSEVCANVVEVQLGEERAKIVLLKQQIQSLQDQIRDLNKKTEAEKLALKDVVAERDHNIFNLKHRINEEIEDKINLKFHCDNEVTKLNNQINELEQTLKDNNDHSRAVIEKKMQEIQTLQEEKLSLIQSLNNKTTQLEKDISYLKAEIDAEKQSKSNMKDSYENHLMKLNEKVLKRNNELVEFQNNICEKSEMIESLQLQLKKERETANALGEYCNSLNSQKFAMENDLQQQSHKINELQKNLQISITAIEDLNIEISNHKTSISELNQNCKDLETARDTLVSEVKDRDSKIEETINDIQKIKEEYSKEKQQLMLDLDEKNETINSLQVQLKDEINFKIDLQLELSQLNNLKTTLNENIEKLEVELSKIKSEVENNEKTIDAMDLYIQEIKKSDEQAIEKIQKMAQDIAAKESHIQLLNNQLEVVNSSLQEEIKQKHDLFSELEPLHEQVKSLLNDHGQLEKDMSVKCQEISELKYFVKELSQQLNDKEAMIQALEQKFIEECGKYDQLELKTATDIAKLTSKMNEVNNIASKCADVLTNVIHEKDTLNNELRSEVENLKKDFIKAQNEIETLMEKISEEISNKTKLEEEYQIQHSKFENLTTQFNSEIESKNVDIIIFKTEIQTLTKTIEDRSEGVKELQEQIRREMEAKNELAYQMKTETKKLQNKIVELEALNDEIEQELKKEMDANELVVKAIKQENEQLHYTVEEDNSHHEVLIKEKDIIIDKLEQTVKCDAVKFNDLHTYSEELKKSWEEYKNQTSMSLKLMNDEILLMKSNHEQLINEKNDFIQKLEQTVKEEVAKFEALHDFSEDLIRSWEESKINTAKSIKEKDEEIMTVKNNILAMEQLLLESKQNNDELCDEISKRKESMKDIEILLSVIETEKEQVINENKALLSVKEQLKTEIAELSQNITLEKCAIKTAEDEKNALLFEKIKIKENLVKNTETVRSLLQDKECLTQQLVEETNLREITEKERGHFIEEKDLLEEKLIKEEKVKSELYHELQTLNQKIEKLQLIVEKDKDTISILEEEKKNLNAELNQVKTNHKYLMEENQDLVLVNDNVKTLLEEINTKQASLFGEKEALVAEKECFVNSLETQINKVNMLEIEKSELKSLADSLRSEGSILQDTCKDMEEKLRHKQTQFDETVIQLKKKEQELNNLQQSVDKTIENLIHKADDATAKVNENAKIVAENSKFKQEAERLQSINDTLEASLSMEKSTRDEIEKERNSFEKKLTDLQAQLMKIKNNSVETINGMQDTCNKTAEQLRNKEQELTSLKTEFKMINEECESIKNSNLMLTDRILSGLNILLAKIKSENYNNETLQKVIAEGYFQDMNLADKCLSVMYIAEALISEVDDLKNVEKVLKNESSTLVAMQESMKQKDIEVFELKTEVNRLQQIVSEKKIEVSKQTETYSTSMNAKIKNIQTLQLENQTLHNDLNDVKVQLEIKVHSLKEKLVDSENLTDKLKKTYECQIDNLNVMITKLTQYLKDKTQELDGLRKDKEQLNETIQEHRKAIKSLEDKVKTEKQNIDKIIMDFDAERQVLKNMVTVTESVMEDQKTSLNNVISDHLKAKETLQDQVNKLIKEMRDTEKKNHAIEIAYSSILSLLRRERIEKDLVEKESEVLREFINEVVRELKNERIAKVSMVTTLETSNKELMADLNTYKKDLEVLQKNNDEFKVVKDSLENEIKNKTDELSKVYLETSEAKKTLEQQINNLTDTQTAINERLSTMNNLVLEKEKLDLEKAEIISELEAFKVSLDSNESKRVEEVTKLKKHNQELIATAVENKTVIANLEQLIKHELEQNRKLRENIDEEKMSLVNQCSTLQVYQEKAEKVLEERQKEIVSLQKELHTLQAKVEICEQESKAKDGLISKMSKEKDAIISTISKELLAEKVTREKCEKELENLKVVMHELKNNLEVRALRMENEQLIRAIGQQETFAALCQEKAASEKYHQEHREIHQVDNTSSDNTQSSMESLKTITDLEKIIQDKNRSLTTLQQDVTYLKSLMAESETKLLDVNKELEVSKENCQQLSSQLKKIVSQKNDEIAELKKHISKMSVTENRATQIIKVSAKYQAIILRRIAEIKSNTILKELTNFGNTNNCDNDLRRSLTAGTVTMEDLENFLETTDRHLKRCAEKQVSLQKERDRLTEVNRIHESEILNLKKFLTELSVSFQTFTSVKDMYAQKLSRVISVQRTVRREILNLDSRITDSTMCKLERGYAAVMQDLSECTMNLERWVERCISRTVSVEKIKQAFTSDSERSSLASPSFQNTGLEIQFEELDKSFQKLLEEVARAQKGDGAKDTQATTVMEVRAEYEDKLNRMKAKMKELFNEQMAVFKEKQKEETSLLERELLKTREKMEDSKLEYEKHIKQLTRELWVVGEKYLVKNDEAEWLKKKQRSGSLMSLQHVHSSGLIQPQELPSRTSDASSLRSLPVTKNTNKREGRQMHMSDEEGEVFDNHWLKELSATPRREAPPGKRLSELKWRNSLCPPHLKSSYPAETQFATVLDEEDLKAGAGPVKPQRKEVGITAYKKPGPPTPSKQAGRLSATGSELRESLRVENDPHADRKTSTPARIRNFLRFSKNDTNEGTPRTRRLSNIFRKNR